LVWDFLNELVYHQKHGINVFIKWQHTTYDSDKNDKMDDTSSLDLILPQVEKRFFFCTTLPRILKPVSRLQVVFLANLTSLTKRLERSPLITMNHQYDMG